MVAQIRPRLPGVPNLVSESPADAARRDYQMADAFGNAAEFGIAVRDHYRQRQLDEADTNAALQYQEAATGVLDQPYVSAEALREIGLDEDFMYEMVPGPDGPVKADREEIPSDEFGPAATEAIMGRIIEANAENITWGADREEWVNSKTRSLANIVLKQSQQAAAAAFARESTADDEAIEALHQAGLHDMAVDRAQNHTDPDKRAEATRTAIQRTALDGYRNAIQSGDIPTIMDARDEVVNDNRLTEAQQTAMYQTLSALIHQASSGNARERVSQWDMELANIGLAIENKDPTAATQVMEFYNKIEEAGRLDYVGKNWLREQMVAIDKVQKEAIEDARQDTVTVAAMYSVTSRPLTEDAKESVERVVSRVIADAAALDMQDPQPESRTGAALNYATRISVANGYIPPSLRAIFHGVDNPASSWENASDALQIYNYFADHAPHLLETIDENQRLAMSFMRSASFAGISDQESFTAFRDAAFNTTKEERDRRLRVVSEETRATGDRNIFGWLDEKLKGHPDFGESFLEAMVPFANFGMDPTDAVRVSFLNSYQMAFLRTGDRDASLNYAYENVASTFGATQVNGPVQIFRRPPEQAFGLDPAYIRKDLHRFLKESVDGIEGDINDYQIVENVDTPYGDPQYSIVRMVDGMPDPLTVNGRALTWIPDVKRIEQDMKKSELSMAEHEHQWEVNKEEEIRKADRFTAEYFGLEGRRERYEQRRAEREAERAEEQEASEAATDQFIERRSGEIARDRDIITDMGLNDGS